jgi:hypothetical protein
MTYEEKCAWIDLAIKQLQIDNQKRFKTKTPVKYGKMTLENHPNELAHQDYCRDMFDLPDYITPWGGEK